MSALTVDQVVTQFLYGSVFVPADLLNDNLIRLPSHTSLSTSLSDFMVSGGGRFAVPSQFALIQEFFNSSRSISAGTYTLTQMETALGLSSSSAVWNTLKNNLIQM